MYSLEEYHTDYYDNIILTNKTHDGSLNCEIVLYVFFTKWVVGGTQ